MSAADATERSTERPYVRRSIRRCQYIIQPIQVCNFAPTGLRHFYWHKRRFSPLKFAISALPVRESVNAPCDASVVSFM